MTIVKSLRGSLVAATVGTVLTFGGLPAIADGVGAPVKVKYSDVDATSAQGAAILYDRIRSAAESVCSPLDHGDVLSRQHKGACLQNLIAHAVDTVDTPALRAVYVAKSGGSLTNTITAAR